ncbi:hypothetical protein J2W95_002348 [Flavobacterium granuli]|uniref:Uncharacterized protein n=1 Tax=Flavobacterium granuli TaxID=280093 RepID=A0ABU1S3R1_9FLAO|nr:hypothetical protein [Flavobacterium granuli]
MFVLFHSFKNQKTSTPTVYLKIICKKMQTTIQLTQNKHLTISASYFIHYDSMPHKKTTY